MIAEVVNTKGMNEALSVLITLEAYFVFFSASFCSSSLSTGRDMFDGAFGCVIRLTGDARPRSFESLRFARGAGVTGLRGSSPLYVCCFNNKAWGPQAKQVRRLRKR